MHICKANNKTNAQRLEMKNTIEHHGRHHIPPFTSVALMVSIAYGLLKRAN